MGPAERVSGHQLSEWWFRVKHGCWCPHPLGSVRSSAVSGVSMCMDCGWMAWWPAER